MPDISRLCVFAGSSPGGNPEYVGRAFELGTLLGEQGIGLVFGGGRVGLMGVVADAALAAGAEVVGVLHGELGARFVEDQLDQRRRVEVDLQRRWSATRSDTGLAAFNRARSARG